MCRCSHLTVRFIAFMKGSVTIPRVLPPQGTHIQAHLDRFDRAVTSSQRPFPLCKVRYPAINGAITKRVAISSWFREEIRGKVAVHQYWHNNGSCRFLLPSVLLPKRVVGDLSLKWKFPSYHYNLLLFTPPSTPYLGKSNITDLVWGGSYFIYEQTGSLICWAPKSVLSISFFISLPAPFLEHFPNSLYRSTNRLY